MSTTQYGIGVTKNRFELADIYDEDPLEALKIHEQEKEAKKKTKLSEKENKGKETVKPKAPVAPRPKGIKETQNLKPQEQKAKEDKTRSQKVLADKSRAPRVERGTSSSNGGGNGERKFSENREEVKNRRNREDRPQGDFHRDDRTDKTERRDYRGDRNDRSSFYGDSNTENRGRGRGGGRGFSGRGGDAGGRGGRGGRSGGGGGSRPGFDSRGKREYDRQSGSDKTGVKSVDKREGSGAHNWGNHRDDLDDMNNPLPQNDDSQQNWSPEKPEQVDNSVGETNGTAVEGDENATPQEEERKELTLDEWKALKALKAPKQKPTFNLRKAGEGEDPSQWKKMYVLQKKKDGEEEEEEEEYVSKMQEYENCEYPQRVGRQKHILDIDIHFKDTRGGVRSRGNRGSGRGGPRMGTRGINSNPNVMEKHSGTGRDNVQKIAPKVDDEHDFPSLG